MVSDLTIQEPIRLTIRERALAMFRCKLAWMDYQLMLTRKKYPDMFTEEVRDEK